MRQALAPGGSVLCRLTVKGDRLVVLEVQLEGVRDWVLVVVEVVCGGKDGRRLRQGVDRVRNVVQRIVRGGGGAGHDRLREGLVVGVQVDADQTVVATAPELFFPKRSDIV